jgi:hypothetical protein
MIGKRLMTTTISTTLRRFWPNIAITSGAMATIGTVCRKIA